MNNYIHNIVSRYSPDQSIVRPRSPGIFEPPSVGSEIPPISFEHKESPASHDLTKNQNVSKIKNQGNKPNLKRDSINESSDLINNRNISNPDNHNNTQEKPVVRNKVERIKNEIINNFKPIKINNKNISANPDIDKNELSEINSKFNTPSENHHSINKYPITNKQQKPLFYNTEYSLQQSSIESFNEIRPHLNQINIQSSNITEQKGATRSTRQPTVKIHIGRIEIKAVKPEIKKTNSPNKKSTKPGNSLEKFLNKRGGNS